MRSGFPRNRAFELMAINSLVIRVRMNGAISRRVGQLVLKSTAIRGRMRVLGVKRTLVGRARRGVRLLLVGRSRLVIVVKSRRKRIVGDRRFDDLGNALDRETMALRQINFRREAREEELKEIRIGIILVGEAQEVLETR